MKKKNAFKRPGTVYSSISEICCSWFGTVMVRWNYSFQLSFNWYCFSRFDTSLITSIFSILLHLGEMRQPKSQLFFRSKNQGSSSQRKLEEDIRPKHQSNHLPPFTNIKRNDLSTTIVTSQILQRLRLCRWGRPKIKWRVVILQTLYPHLGLRGHNCWTRWQYNRDHDFIWVTHWRRDRSNLFAGM